MPMGNKAFIAQPANGPLGEKLILKTAAGERDVGLAGGMGESDDELDESVVDFGGNDCDRLLVAELHQNLSNRWLPVENRHSASRISEPSASIKTPSAEFGIQPASRNSVARRYTNGRNPTP